MARVVVFHGGFGCDTGCCGHYVELDPVEPEGDPDGSRAEFNFDHPYGDDPRAFAENLVRKEFGSEHVADLDWEHSVIVDGTSC